MQTLSRAIRIGAADRIGIDSAQSGLIVVPAICFAITLCLGLLHHCLGQEVRLTFFSDSGHYLESCRQIVALVREVVAGGQSALSFQLALANLFSQHLMLDGPILPLMPAIFFILIGKIPQSLDWQPFVIMQCLVHSLSAALVAVLMRKLTNSFRWSFLGGLCWGIYPAALIACGRYLTETPTVLFLLTLIWSASRVLEDADRSLDEPDYVERKSRKFPAMGLWLGISNGVIFLLKPALAPACMSVDLILLFFLRQWKQRLVALAIMLAGFGLVISPWAWLTKIATGTMYLTAQRGPTYNVAKGVDTEADGWGALPDTPMAQYLTDTPGVLPTIIAAWHFHPIELVNLTLRKVTRLWAVPWNDFRSNIFGIPLRFQMWWHILMIALAVPGILALLAGIPQRMLLRRSARVASFIGLSSVLIILGHLLYIAFEAISRYGFTSMPFVVLFSMYALFAAYRRPSLWLPMLAVLGLCFSLAFLWCFAAVPYFVAVVDSFRVALLLKFACECLVTAMTAVAAFIYIEKAAVGKTWVKILTALSLIVALAVQFAFCLDSVHATQWQCTLAPGQSACRELYLPAGMFNSGINPSLAAVLVDGDQTSQDAVITINGHRLEQAPELLLRMRPSHYFSFDIMRTFAAKLGVSVDKIRQWRVVTFPVAWLQLNELNVIRLSPAGNSSVRIYGDYEDAWIKRRQLPTFDYFSGGMVCNTFAGLEGRLTNPVSSSPPQANCWLEEKSLRNADDLSGDGGRQTGQYRLFLLLGFAHTVNSSLFRTANGTPIAKEADASVATASKAINDKKSISSIEPVSQYTRKLSPSDFDPLIGNTLVPGCDFRINKAIFKAVSKLACQVDIPAQLLSAAYLRVRVSGDVRAASADGLVSVLPLLESAGNSPYAMVLPATPPYLKAGSSWSHFEMNDIVPPSRFPKGLKSIEISLFPGPWEEVWQYGLGRRNGDACFRNLKIDMETFFGPRIENQALMIY